MDLDELWRAALNDAGIDPGDALMFVFPGAGSKNGDTAKTWVRGVLIDDPNDCESLGIHLEEANSDWARAVCRVAIWTDRSHEGVAGLMRHELEHSRQFDVHGEALQRLHARAVDVLIEHAGGSPGSNSLYNAIPMEADANAAAAAERSFFLSRSLPR